MNLLAFDTATTGCSAAAFIDGTLSGHRSAAMARGQSEALMPMIDEVLSDAGLTYQNLSALAVTVGPGAFTGLRIGLAAARGLAIGLGLPLAGVTTLEAVASSVPDDIRDGRHVAVALDSKREDLYFQVFDPDLVPLSAPAAVMPENLLQACPGADLVVAGDAEDRALNALAGYQGKVIPAGVSGVPDAALVGIIALGRPLPAAGDPPAPIYLRPPDAVRPKNGGRLRP